MPSRAALARHPLAIAGAVITTVTAVVFIVLAIAVVMGLFENPYAGLVVFIGLPAIFVLGSAADPGRDVAAAAKTATPSRCGRGLARPGFPAAGGPSRGPAHRRTHRRQSGDFAARRVWCAPLDGIAVVLRGDVPRTDAPAVHRVAGGAALGSHVHAVSRWRRRQSTRALQARRHAAAVSRPDQPGPQTDTGCRRHASGARDVRQVSLAGPRFRRRHQGQAGVRGRRRQLGDSDDLPDVRWRAGPADVERPGDSLACRSRRPHRVRLHGSRAAEDPLRAPGPRRTAR